MLSNFLNCSNIFVVKDFFLGIGKGSLVLKASLEFDDLEAALKSTYITFLFMKLPPIHNYIK